MEAMAGSGEVGVLLRAPRTHAGTFGRRGAKRSDHLRISPLCSPSTSNLAAASPRDLRLDAAARTLASPIGPDTPTLASRGRSMRTSVSSPIDRTRQHPSESPLASPEPVPRPVASPVRTVSLETRLADLRRHKKRLSPLSTGTIMYQLTRAVAHAAGLGVCHGDITPACVSVSLPSMHVVLSGMCAMTPHFRRGGFPSMPCS